MFKWTKEAFPATEGPVSPSDLQSTEYRPVSQELLEFLAIVGFSLRWGWIGMTESDISSIGRYIGEDNLLVLVFSFFSIFSFLAVQNSSIGDLVTDSLTD